jgi:cytochrome b561
MAESAYRYPFAVRWLHWLGAILVLVAYLTGESAEQEELASGAVNWHVLAGLGLLLLFLPRLLAKFWIRKPAVLQSSAAEVWMARTIQLALLLFVLVEPLLGVFAVWAEGQPLLIPLTSWQLPALLDFGPGAGETLEELHETVGNVFYAVIGLQVLAAFWHHFRRRDGVLRRML